MDEGTYIRRRMTISVPIVTITRESGYMDAAGREVLGVLGRGDDENKGCAGFCPSSSTNILLCQKTEFAHGEYTGPWIGRPDWSQHFGVIIAAPRAPLAVQR
jgi:hypothetical protein